MWHLALGNWHDTLDMWGLVACHLCSCLPFTAAITTSQRSSPGHPLLVFSARSCHAPLQHISGCCYITIGATFVI